MAKYNASTAHRDDEILAKNWVPISVSVVETCGRLVATCELNDADALYDALLTVLARQ